MHGVVNKTQPPTIFAKVRKAWHSYPTNFQPITFYCLPRNQMGE